MNHTAQTDFEQPASFAVFIRAARDVFAAPGPWPAFNLALADLGSAARAVDRDVPGDYVEVHGSLAAVALLANEIRADPRHPAADSLSRHLARALLSFGVTLEEMERWPGFVHEDATTEVPNHA